MDFELGGLKVALLLTPKGFPYYSANFIKLVKGVGSNHHKNLRQNISF